MNTLTLVLVLSLVSVFLVEGRRSRGRDHEGDTYYDYDYEYDDYRAGHRSRDKGLHKFIRTFLRTYCGNVAGDYKRCQQCVDVGCLRYMKGPTYITEYENCVGDNNRCCTQPGIGGETSFLAGKCYATGVVSEVGAGQLSIARAFLGGQAKDAPEAFQGRSKP